MMIFIYLDFGYYYPHYSTMFTTWKVFSLGFVFGESLWLPAVTSGWREWGFLLSTENSITPVGSMVALLCLLVAHSGHLWESPNHSNLLVSHSDKKETHERRQESHHFVEWKASQVKIERKTRGWLQIEVIKESGQDSYTGKEKSCG